MIKHKKRNFRNDNKDSYYIIYGELKKNPTQEELDKVDKYNKISIKFSDKIKDLSYIQTWNVDYKGKTISMTHFGYSDISDKLNRKEFFGDDSKAKPYNIELILPYYRRIGNGILIPDLY